MIRTKEAIEAKMAALPVRAVVTVDTLTDEEREVLDRHRKLMSGTSQRRTNAQTATAKRHSADRLRRERVRASTAARMQPYTLFKQHPQTGVWQQFTSTSMLLVDAQRVWRHLPAGYEIRPVVESHKVRAEGLRK